MAHQAYSKAPGRRRNDPGTLYQNYFSGVSIISTRPSKESVGEMTDRSDQAITLDGNLMWLKPKQFGDLKPWNNGSPGQPVVFRFFKQQVNRKRETTPGPTVISKRCTTSSRTTSCVTM